MVKVSLVSATINEDNDFNIFLGKPAESTSSKALQLR